MAVFVTLCYEFLKKRNGKFQTPLNVFSRTSTSTNSNEHTVRIFRTTETSIVTASEPSHYRLTSRRLKNVFLSLSKTAGTPAERETGRVKFFQGGPLSPPFAVVRSGRVISDIATIAVYIIQRQQSDTSNTVLHTVATVAYDYD